MLKKCLNFLFILFLIGLVQSCFLKKQIAYTSQYKSFEDIEMKTSLGDTASGTLSFLMPYKKTLDAQMNVVIGATNKELKKEKPNSTLGNMVADAMYTYAHKLDTNVVASVANYGGIRIPNISMGNITLGKIYELMPFDNNLCIVNLSGALVDTLCQYMARSGGWPISHLSFNMKNNFAQEIVVNNMPLNYNKNYAFALNDYMANGGDNCNFLVPLTKRNCNILVRDAIINFVKQNKNTLVKEPFKRIK